MATKMADYKQVQIMPSQQKKHILSMKWFIVSISSHLYFNNNKTSFRPVIRLLFWKWLDKTKGAIQSSPHGLYMDHGHVHSHSHMACIGCWKQEACSLVNLNCQDMRSDSPNQMMPLAGSGLERDGDHLNIWNSCSSVCYNARILFIC